MKYRIVQTYQYGNAVRYKIQTSVFGLIWFDLDSEFENVLFHTPEEAESYARFRFRKDLVVSKGEVA